MNRNVELSRSELKAVLDDVASQLAVHTLTVSESLREAWVLPIDTRRGHWEFHYGPFYWHGHADNAYDARAKGWSAWLRLIGAPGYQTEAAC